MTPERVSTEELEEVKQIVSHVAKAAKTYQMYRPGNKMFIRSLDNLKSSLDRFFSQQERLTLVVKEFELLYKGETVYAQSDKHQSIAFRLYRDGIRLLTFHHDVTTDELVSFFDALTKSFDVDRIEEDLVTLLWERDLHGISYLEVTDIEPGGLEGAAQPRSASEGITQPFDTSLRWNKVANAVNAIKPAIALSASEIEEVQSLTFSIHDDLFLRKVWEVLCLTFETEPTLETFLDLENAFIGFLNRCLMTQHVGLAADVLSRIRIIAENLKDDRANQAVNRIIATRLSEENLKIIRNMLAGYDEVQHIQCLSYLSRLNTEAVEPILQMLPVCENTSSKQTIIGALATLAAESPECLLNSVGDASPVVAEAIISVLETIGSQDVLQLAVTFADHASARVRGKVASILGSVKSEKSIQALTRLTEDEDIGVKRRALVSLARLQSEKCVDRMGELFTSKEFAKMPHDSKMALLLTIRSLPPQRQYQVAQAILKVRRFIGRRDIEDTKVALMEIAHLLDNEALIKLLHEIAERSSGRLNRAAQNALKRICNDPREID